MGSDILALVDSDREYLEKFINYFHSKQGEIFECRAFTDVDRMETFAGENRIDVLMISGELMEERVLRTDAREILILGEEDIQYQEANVRNINRFQSTDGIIREIMRSRAEDETAVRKILSGAGVKTEFIAVFSPVKRTLKTTFAITLGQLLAEKRKTLYINLEECAGFNQIFQMKYEADISDLLFFMKGRKSNFAFKLQSMVMNTQGLDYIPPAMSASDIISVTEEDWLEFMNEIAECGYDKVIIDIGDGIQGLGTILAGSGIIYMPIRQDSVSKAKTVQFEALMHMSGQEEMLNRIKKIVFPFFQDVTSYAGDCRETELAHYIEDLKGDSLHE